LAFDFRWLGTDAHAVLPKVPFTAPVLEDRGRILFDNVLAD
jgi:hypothetical protein